MRSGAIVVYANGNLNGRVPRLIADEFARTWGRQVRLIHCVPLVRWPEEAANPHLVPAERVSWEEATRACLDAAVVVYPPSFEWRAMAMFREARCAGVPSLAVLPDIGFGAERFQSVHALDLPEQLGVADPVTRDMLIERGVPESICRGVGSPYLDTVLVTPRPPRLDAEGLHVGFLLNPDMSPAEAERSTQVNYRQADAAGTLARAVAAMTDTTMTVRPHPRMEEARARALFEGVANAEIDPTRSRSTMEEFCARQHVILATNSSGLIVARLLGLGAVSFQPAPEGLAFREALFEAWGIPIVRDVRELASALHRASSSADLDLPLDRLLYNPGRSLEVIARLTVEFLDRARTERVA